MNLPPYDVEVRVLEVTASVWTQPTVKRAYACQRQVLPMLRGLTCIVTETQPTLACCCTEESETLP